MRSALSVVMERNSHATGSLVTEPYEAGWATEAMWFVEALDPLEVTWTARVEISPDGLRWCPWGGQEHPLADPGLTALPVTHFGTWLRIVLTATGSPQGQGRFMVTLALK